MSFNVAKPVQNLQSSQSYSSLNGLNLILPKRSGFKLASLNLTSLVKHVDELRVFLANNEIDVLAINETRLDGTISDNEVHIHGYEIVRRDRKLNGRLGGGVAFIFVIPLVFLFVMIYRLIHWKIYVFRLKNINRNLFLYQSGIGRQVHLLRSSNTSSHFLVDLTQKILNSIF